LFIKTEDAATDILEYPDQDEAIEKYKNNSFYVLL